MLTVQQLPKRSQGIAWKLKEFCEKHGIQYAFRKSNGNGHPSIQVWHDGETRKLAFSSSPSDHRAPNNAVRQLKHKLIEMGWSPAQRELDIGEKAVTPEQTFKNQKVSTGAASPVTSIDPKIVRGVAIPVAGKATLAERNEAMLQAYEAGAPEAEIVKGLHAAGWDKVNTVSGHLTRARNVREGKDPHEKRTERTYTKAKTAEQETPQPDPTFYRQPKAATGATATDIALEIAEAIAPVIRKHLQGHTAEIDELREKARKFDDLKNLIG